MASLFPHGIIAFSSEIHLKQADGIFLFHSGWCIALRCSSDREKLRKGNYLLWKAQVLPTIRGAQMFGYLDGTAEVPVKEIKVKEGDKVIKKVNSDFTRWVTKDQQVLDYLMTTLTRDVLMLLIILVKFW
jgi:hypothetical protein